jgi:glycosyltransferase involved in cell wall biosynthesis
VNVLFISYDGLMEPLGQSQVRQYLRGLACEHRIVLVSFEKSADLDDLERRARMKADVERENIHWVPLRYHKTPTLPATAFDVAIGIAVCTAVVLRWQIELVHARSFVASNIALALKKTLGVPFIFDMRGFWVDEKVEAGSIPAGSRVFHVLKRGEALLLKEAAAVVSLTHAAVRVMQALPCLQGVEPRFAVIPTCTNLEAFSSGPKPSRPGSDDFVLGYVGAVGAWDVFDEVARCFKVLLELKPKARLVVINRGGHEYIARSFERNAVPLERTEVRSADHAGVPHEIHRMDAGIFFYKPGYSRSACAPTKLGEFLASGVPCLCNAGVGDVESILESERVGVILHEMTDAARRAAVSALVALSEDSGIQQRCAAVAAKAFSLTDGVRAYDALYRDVQSRERLRAASGAQ